MKTYKVQKEFSKGTENSGKESILKSTPYIVFDIFLERYVTAGVLGKETKINFKCVDKVDDKILGLNERNSLPLRFFS